MNAGGIPACTRRRLVALMTDGAFHSGESLAAELGLSRAAVWKQVQGLQEEGLVVESVHGRGYRLQSRVELLEPDRIQAQLPPPVRESIELIVHEDIDSTNRCLIEHPGDGRGRVPVCLAERQSAGRGRHGRRWHTPYGTALALSLRWRFEGGAGALAGLSLAVGVAAAEYLEGRGFDGVRLKWPNDLVVRPPGRALAKLGGILIELSGDAAGPCDVVIGIGLNVTVSTGLRTGPGGAGLRPGKPPLRNNMADVDQPWIDLYTLQPGADLSRNRLAAGLTASLVEMLPRFEDKGFTAFRQAFNRRDALHGRPVAVHQGGRALYGTASGVDRSGALLVDYNGYSRAVTSGEVTLREADA